MNRSQHPYGIRAARHEENSAMPVYDPLATEFSPPNSEYSDSTIPAELSGVLRPEVSQPETQSMHQAEGMTALLIYFMAKDEREGMERERKDREHPKFERKRLEFEERKERDCLEFEVRQLELDRELHNKKFRQAACQQLKNWDDNTDPIAYFDNFELVMREAKISQEE